MAVNLNQFVTNADNAPPKQAAERTRYTPQTTIAGNSVSSIAGNLNSNPDKNKNTPATGGLSNPSGGPAFDSKLRHPAAAPFFMTGQSDKLIIYVNGMNTGPKDHLEAAQILATIADQPVLGIFNRTGINGKKGGKHFYNGLIDAGQCVHDQLLPVGRSRDVVQGLTNPLGLIGSKLLGKLTKVTQSSTLKKAQRYLTASDLIFNMAALALFDVTYDCADAMQKVIIVCHSQGNLITSNALWALKHARRSFPGRIMGDVQVLGLASPTVSWPDEGVSSGFKFKLFRDDRDIITAISLPGLGQSPTATFKGPGLGLAAHGVVSYMLWEPFQRELARAMKG